jgi:short-subunit dehydrogenase
MVDIAIPGASSGLGRAIALGYARPGVTLHLAGRHAARLAGVAAEARARGAKLAETVVDVTDKAAMEAWVRGCGRLDLMVANAGISTGPGDGPWETPAQISTLFETNIFGVFNTVLPALALMAARPPGADGLRGRIAVIGSIAGLIALPNSPAYSASKALLDFWITGTGPSAVKAGIGLTLVRPGFIRTPMTAHNPFIMPGLMDAEAAAAKIIAGVAAGKTRITFPWWLAAMARLGQMMPKTLLAGMKKKPAL